MNPADKAALAAVLVAGLAGGYALRLLVLHRPLRHAAVPAAVGLGAAIVGYLLAGSGGGAP